jgi:putative DNA primase/helicase
MTERQKRKQAAPIATDEDLNDIGNAKRFARFFVGRIAYVPELGSWCHWSDKRWLDDNDEAMRDAAVIARSWFDDLAEEPDTGRQKRLLAHAQRSSNVNSLRAMLEIARTRGLTVKLPEWDADSMLLGTPAGAIDLRTGTALAPDPRLRIRKAISCNFDPEAKAPTWSAFLARIFDGDVAMIAFLQRGIGYSLTGNTSEECLFICHGAGMNGKSKLIGTLRAMFADYGRDCAAETLLARRDDGIPNDVARLAGARFVSAIETEDGKRLAEAMVKAMTGGDRIVARFLHREFFEFQPAFKVRLATNHKPTIRGDDLAIWRRIRLIPFAVTIPEEERDKDLLGKLTAELPGVLAWAVRGCLDWQRDGLQSPEPVRAATAAYRQDMDRLGQWIEERCIVTPSIRVKASLAFKDYREWSEARGEYAMTLTAFGNKLTERGIKKERAKTVTYVGIGLSDSRDTCDSSSLFSSYTPAREKKRGNWSQSVASAAVDPESEAERAAIQGEPMSRDVEYKPTIRGE